MSEHLELFFIPESFDRPNRQGFGTNRLQRSFQEKKIFYETSIEKFNQFELSQNEKKAKFTGYFDPQLIFKIDLNIKENENIFRDELRKANIQILSPCPDKSGYWVAFADENDLHTFRTRLDNYASERSKLDILNSITGFDLIPREEKIGNRLREFVIQPDSKIYIDVELWRMHDVELHRFIEGIEKFINKSGCRVTDRLVKKNFCLLRISANQEAIEMLLDCNEVCYIELPPQPYLDYSYFKHDIESFQVINNLTPISASIAVLDSGIVSNHPLFQEAVAYEIPDSTGNTSDDTGHGSKVAGIALYGDIKKCIDEKQFNQSIWIVSAKIMFNDGNGYPKYDPEKLLEHQLQEVVEEIRTNYAHCRIFNLSLGNNDNKVFELRKQYNLAVLLDELAKEYDLVFTVSTGNIPISRIPLDNYPEYFQQEIPDFKLIDPSSAALAITVGSIAHVVGPLPQNQGDLFYVPATLNYPSPFTCAGPGFKGMIKPELVEYGGNVINTKYSTQNNLAGKVLSLNRDFASDGRLFSADIGTSMSCPKIAHQLAILINHYPEKGNNMIKALLISSAKIPTELPKGFTKIAKATPDKELLPLLNLYGYGLPSISEALESESDKVLLIRENRIGLNKIHLYRIDLPESLFSRRGKRFFSVTLTYDPPINKNRLEYLGCSMGFTLFKNTSIEDVSKAYKKVQVDESTDINEMEEKISIPSVKLQPGANIRNRGVHQKGIAYFDKLLWEYDKPLVLAIVCQNKHIRNEDYLQNYAVVVKVEHEGNIELYNQIRLRNIARAQVRG